MVDILFTGIGLPEYFLRKKVLFAFKLNQEATYSTLLKRHSFPSGSHVEKMQLNTLSLFFFIQLFISVLTFLSQAALQLPTMFIRAGHPASLSFLNSYYTLLSLLVAFFQPRIFLKLLLIKKACLSSRHDSKGQICALHRKISFNQNA